MPKPETGWLFTVALGAGLLLPFLVRQGMFLDGVSYACIARNMAEGVGTFATPQYTATLYAAFHEQPPLAIWLQSHFFQLFGDHFWTERLYSGCMALLAGGAIALNWNLLRRHSQPDREPAVRLAWLPVIFWIATPVVFWSYRNNMLECTMSVFVLLATYFALKAMLSDRTSWLIPASVMTAAAVLCKGPVGAFPIVAPFVAALVGLKGSLFQGMSRSLVMALLTAASLSLVMFAIPGMTAYLDDYLKTRLLSTLSGARDATAPHRFVFLQDLLSQLAAPLLVAAVAAFRTGRQLPVMREAVFYLAMGLAGTLPLILSPKQSTHYLLPAMPYFAMAFAQYLTPLLDSRISFAKSFSGNTAKWRCAGLLSLAAGCILPVFCWGHFNRHEQRIRDVQAVSSRIPAGTVIASSPGTASDWTLAAYLCRIGRISLDGRNEQPLFLTIGNEKPVEQYVRPVIETSEITIWKK